MLAMVFHPLLHSLTNLTKSKHRVFAWGSLDAWPSSIFHVPVFFLLPILNMYNCYSDCWQFSFHKSTLLTTIPKSPLQMVLKYINYATFLTWGMKKLSSKWFLSKWSATYCNSLSPPVMATCLFETRSWACLKEWGSGMFPEQMGRCFCMQKGKIHSGDMR